MPIVIRDFETMVDETLQRVVNANIGITNILPGSVIRTIIESLLAELDIQNYTINQIYNAMNIDTATGSDLDAIVSILGIARKQATYAEGTVVFGRSDEYSTDIAIQYAQMISTKQNPNNDDIYEFIVTDNNAKLNTGELQTTVNVRAINPGHIYLPQNTITVMNMPIIGIEYVTNIVEINSGTDQETDDELRERAKYALAGLGKGTSTALRSAILELPGVIDAVVNDMPGGVGTSEVVVITDVMPPSEALQNSIKDTIRVTKPAGVYVEAIFPTIFRNDIAVTINNISDAGNIPNDSIDKVANAIISYCNTLSVGDTLIISQLERAIGNVLDSDDFDIIVTLPNSNITSAITQVIRCGSITINGVMWNG